MVVLRWSLAVVAVIAVLVVFSLTAEPGEWRQAVMWAEQRAQVLERQAAEMPPFFVDAWPGDARDQFEVAVAAATTVAPETTARLRDLAAGAAEPADGEVAALAAGMAFSSGELRAAVHMAGSLVRASDFGRVDFEQVRFGELFPVVDMWLVVARHGVGPEQRVDAWLDALACGLELSRTATPLFSAYGVIMVERTIEVGGDTWLRALPEAELQRLAEALIRADGLLVPESSTAAVALNLVLMLARSDERQPLRPLQLGFANRYQTWQHGFSLWKAGVERACSVVEQVQHFEREARTREPWPQRRVRLEALMAWDARVNGDLAFGYFEHLVDFEQLRRISVAGLRLLRVAVAAHLSRELPVLADPLTGGQLGCERTAAGLRLFAGDGEVERTVVR